jgi:hypothetical protein
MCLNDVSSINNNEIENEYKRIKEKSGCIDWFDNLIKASFKSYVLFITWDPKTSNSKYSDNEFYDQISIKDFIHKCYIETCEYFKENPEIFLKKNSKKEIYDIIKICIETAIKKTLPFNDIIQEFLKINFVEELESNQKNKREIDNIKNLLVKIMSQNKYGNRPVSKALLTDSSDKKYNVDEQFARKELENYINMNKSVTNQTGGNDIVEYENKEIFRPHSASLSKHDSSKSKTKLETSDDFQVPEHGSYKSSTRASINKNVSSISKDDDSNNNNEKKSSAKYRELSNFDKMTSSHIMTRSEVKNKELDLVMNNANLKTSVTSATSTEEHLTKHVESPIPIKKGHIERIHEDANLHAMTGGTKRKIQIIKNKSNSIHDKVSNMNNYFNGLMNN